MTIQSDVLELQNLDAELKRTRKQLKMLQQQKQNCENRILIYLETNEQPGLRMNGSVIMATDKRTRKYQNKTDRNINGEQVLQKYGIHSSKEALEELLEVLRGPVQTKSYLKMY
jgi:hypothetical protein